MLRLSRHKATLVLRLGRHESALILGLEERSKVGRESTLQLRLVGEEGTARVLRLVGVGELHKVVLVLLELVDWREERHVSALLLELVSA